MDFWFLDYPYQKTLSEAIADRAKSADADVLETDSTSVFVGSQSRSAQKRSCRSATGSDDRMIKKRNDHVVKHFASL
jgi:hypothetical protein